MSHLVQRSLGAPADVRPRMLTPYEPDTMKASFTGAPTRPDPLAGAEFDRGDGPTAGAHGIPMAHFENRPAPQAPPPPREFEHRSKAPRPAPLWHDEPGTLQSRARTQSDPPFTDEPADRRRFGSSTEKTLREWPQKPVIRTPVETPRRHRATDRGAVERGASDSQAYATRPRLPKATPPIQQYIEEPSVDEPRAVRRRGQRLAKGALLQQTSADELEMAFAAGPQRSQPEERRVTPPTIDGEAAQARTPVDHSAASASPPTSRDADKPAPVERQPLLVPRPQPLGAVLQAGPVATEPVIHVTIGRVEIRAVTAPAGKPEKRTAPARPTLTLGDYLDRRGGGRK